jgi:hypothetical protein
VKKRVWLAKGYGSFCYGVANVARDRSGQHDSQGQSAVGGEERCDGSSGFYRRAVWHRCLTPSPGKTPISSFRPLEPIFAMKPAWTRYSDSPSGRRVNPGKK